MIETLIEKHNGERTFFDGELVGVYFTVANLEKFAKEYHNKICSDLNVEGWACSSCGWSQDDLKEVK